MRWLLLGLVLLLGCVQPETADQGDVMVPPSPEGPPDGTPPAGPDSYPDNMTEGYSGGSRIIRNARYSNASERLLLDIYIPDGQGTPPLVVYIHPGAWMIGSKEGCHGKELARNGYAVACINYRLSDEARFPAQIYDVEAAITWLRAHSADYGYDASRVGVWGESAGGHLSALIGTSGEGQARVDAVCDWFGPTDFFDVENETDPGGDYYDYYEAAVNLVGGPLRENEGAVRDANPITHVTSDDPPFLIIHGTDDRTVPAAQSRKLHDALQAAGVESELIIVQGGGHGFQLYDEQGPSEEFRAVIDFFDEELKP